MIIEHLGNVPQIGRNVYIAPTAVIVGDVVVEEGASVWFNAVLRGDEAQVRVGRNTNIQDNCTVHTDTDKPAIIGEDVTIGHNAIVHGCTVENLCLIGMGAIVLNDARIKSGSVVAAGSVVREGQTVGPNQLVAGSPAIVKRELSADIREILRGPVNSYLRLSRAHKTNRIITDDN